MPEGWGIRPFKKFPWGFAWGGDESGLELTDTLFGFLKVSIEFKDDSNAVMSFLTQFWHSYVDFPKSPDDSVFSNVILDPVLA